MATLITVHDLSPLDNEFYEFTLNADFIVEVYPVETAFNRLNESPSYIKQLAHAARNYSGIRTVVYDANGKCLGLLKETSAQLKALIKQAEEADAKMLAMAANDSRFNKLFNP